jgi:hypothetical protein
MGERWRRRSIGSADPRIQRARGEWWPWIEGTVEENPRRGPASKSRRTSADNSKQVSADLPPIWSRYCRSTSQGGADLYSLPFIGLLRTIKSRFNQTTRPARDWCSSPRVSHLSICYLQSHGYVLESLRLSNFFWLDRSRLCSSPYEWRAWLLLFSVSTIYRSATYLSHSYELKNRFGSRFSNLFGSIGQCGALFPTRFSTGVLIIATPQKVRSTSFWLDYWAATACIASLDFWAFSSHSK